MNKLGRGPLEDATCIQNIKALAVTVWDKKIFKNFRLYLCEIRDPTT